MRTPHTSVYRGKRVEVRLRSGQIFVAKFREGYSNYVQFDDRAVVRSLIKSFKIVKGKPKHLNA